MTTSYRTGATNVSSASVPLRRRYHVYLALEAGLRARRKIEKAQARLARRAVTPTDAPHGPLYP
jgi:hypothetical protein